MYNYLRKLGDIFDFGNLPGGHSPLFLGDLFSGVPPGAPLSSRRKGRERRARGREFRLSLPLDSHSQRPREGDCGPPPLGSFPGLFYCKSVASGPYFVTALRARGSFAPGGFPKGRGRSPSLWSRRGCPEGDALKRPPLVVLGGSGGLFLTARIVPQVSSSIILKRNRYSCNRRYVEERPTH